LAIFRFSPDAAVSASARWLAWACAIAIAILSLVPGSERPHTVLPKTAEHFAAYLGAGFFLALGYRSARQRLIGWLGLAVASGLFELLQGFIPGRSPSPLDAGASAAGLTAGMAFAAAASAAVRARVVEVDDQVPGSRWGRRPRSAGCPLPADSPRRGEGTAARSSVRHEAHE